MMDRGDGRVNRPFADPAQPAPGRLELVRSFLNSAEHEHDWEEFRDLGTTTAWLRDAGLAPVRPVTEQDRLRLVRLRTELRALATANREPRPLDTDRLNAALRTAPLVARVDEHGAVSLEPAGEGVVAVLLGITAAALLDGSWSRLKTCRTCGWGFYDRSRNRAGQWCAMRVCGSRNKMRAFRERRA